MDKENGTDKKVIIGIPHHDHFTVAWPFVACLIDLDLPFKIVHSSGSMISIVRNAIYRQAKHHDADYLLMIDSDMTFTKQNVLDIIKSIEETGADMVSALYFRKDGLPSAYEVADDQTFGRYAPIKKWDGRMEVKATGLAFNIIGRRALYGLAEFPFDRYMKNGIYVGEDIAFCDTMNEKDMKIILDPSIKVGHLRLGSVDENYRDDGMRAYGG